MAHRRSGVAADVKRVAASLPAFAAACALTLASREARADDGAAGFALAFGTAAGYALAGLPYFVARDSGPKGPAGDVSFGLGLGRRANAFALGSEMGGLFANGGRVSHVARARIDVDQATRSASSIAVRFDGVLGISLIGDRARPLSGELLVGGTAWPSFRDTGSASRPYGAAGPLAGFRLRFASARPFVYSEAEVDYVALFGVAPSGRHHHVELVSTLGFSPWPAAFGAPAFELRLKREVGLGAATAVLGDDTTALPAYGGTVVLVGMRFAILNRDY